MTIMERLNQLTYAVQHNPNCPQPFLVRLPGWGCASLDLLQAPFWPRLPGHTSDLLGYGQTLEEAAEKALAAKEASSGQKVMFRRSAVL